MKAYLAAAYTTEQKQKMQGVRDCLVAMGHEITSRWIDQGGEGLTKDDIGRMGRLNAAVHAREDLDDVGRADTIIIFTDEPSTTGGFHVEFGYALGRGNSIIVVGPILNIFQALPGVVHFENWGRLVMFLQRESRKSNAAPR